MANQLKMVDVVSILTLHARGWSCRRIARELGVDRDAVSRHVKLSAAGAGTPGGGAQPPGVSKPATEALAGIGVDSEADESKPASEALTGIFTDPAEHESKPATEALTGILAGQEAVSTAGGRGAELAPARSRCAPWRPFIIDQLAAGQSAQRIYQDLVSDHGYTGSYHSVCRMARKLNRAAGGGLPFRRMECSPGDEAQVDFGSGARIVGADGRRHRSHVFRIVLSHSRKGYSEAVDRQTTDNFLRCLENAFHHFGGVPRTLVIDNLRAAVARADWYEPELCPKAASFAVHYGIAILPAKPYTPRHKGKVERGIGYVKGNALRGRVFPSLAEQNAYLAEWESSVADLRIHGTTRRQVREAFEQSERGALQALPAGRFELFQERSAACIATGTWRSNALTTRCRRSLWGNASGSVLTGGW